MGENEQAGQSGSNEEYVNPTSPTAAQPIPPETFAAPVEAEPSSDELYRQDIRAGVSQEEADANADARAQANRDAAGQEPVGDGGTPEPPAEPSAPEPPAAEPPASPEPPAAPEPSPAPAEPPSPGPGTETNY